MAQIVAAHQVQLEQSVPVATAAWHQGYVGRMAKAALIWLVLVLIALVLIECVQWRVGDCCL